ncbi:hypothetical protein ACP4OV_016309 [Aristida adscensionis]
MASCPCTTQHYNIKGANIQNTDMASYRCKKVAAIVALLTLVSLNVSYILATRAPSTSGLEEEAMKARHEMWMVEYGRTYRDEVEKAHRFKVFKENIDFIERSSRAAGNGKYPLKINKFADMSKEEFKAMYTRSNPVSSTTAKKVPGFKYANVTLTDLPEEVDWIKNGAVTKIKDQKDCECCWAFCVVAAVEGVHQIKTGKLLSLSEQELLDCTGKKNDCDRGRKNEAFEYIVKNGITTEDAYPYTAKKGSCQSVEPVVKITKYELVPRDNEEALLAAVAHQPVAVAIDASDKFDDYDDGVFLGKDCGALPNHAVTVVGYGSHDGTKYWLLKNNWGEDWGENGYMRLERGTNACGIAKYASYPVA